MSRSLLLAAVLGLAGGATLGDPPTGAFRFTEEVVVAGEPGAVWDLFTGDVSPWWDHHFAVKPASLVIERVAGGAFREVFDAEGNGCVHATVTWAERGRRLRLDGPLGLAGNATHLVSTLEFAPDGDARTRITLSCEAAGHVEPGWAEVVAKTWRHFLVERFEPYAAGAR